MQCPHDTLPHRCAARALHARAAAPSARMCAYSQPKCMWRRQPRQITSRRAGHAGAGSDSAAARPRATAASARRSRECSRCVCLPREDDRGNSGRGCTSRHNGRLHPPGRRSRRLGRVCARALLDRLNRACEALQESAELALPRGHFCCCVRRSAKRLLPVGAHATAGRRVVSDVGHARCPRVRRMHAH